MFQNVDSKSLTLNPFSAIGDQWMLITAGTPDRCNTMTASWGGLGVIWGAPGGHLLHPPPAVHQAVCG